MKNFELKYKSSLGIATTMYTCAKEKNDKEMAQSLELIFPELKESEDERIRKEILNVFKEFDVGTTILGRKYDYAKWIAWLEKQKVPASDIPKPKFKVGDWVMTDYDNAVYIESISEANYLLQCTDGHHERMTVEYVDRCWRPWTVQDAKDGDVLHSTGWNNDCIFIFKGTDRWIFDETNRDKVVATGYCCLFVSSDKMELGLQGPDCIEVNTIKPATKIQRDLLFEKMEKAGYKWDDEKKELNKYGDNE